MNLALGEICAASSSKLSILCAHTIEFIRDSCEAGDGLKATARSVLSVTVGLDQQSAFSPQSVYFSHFGLIPIIHEVSR